MSERNHSHEHQIMSQQDFSMKIHAPLGWEIKFPAWRDVLEGLIDSGWRFDNGMGSLQGFCVGLDGVNRPRDFLLPMSELEYALTICDQCQDLAKNEGRQVRFSILMGHMEDDGLYSFGIESGVKGVVVVCFRSVGGGRPISGLEPWCDYSWYATKFFPVIYRIAGGVGGIEWQEPV